MKKKTLALLTLICLVALAACSNTQAPQPDEQMSSEPDAPTAPSTTDDDTDSQPTTANPANNNDISQERAAEIALEFMPGTLIEVDNDFEHGRAVWYVSIRADGHIHEIYVDRQTGEIVLHESYLDD